MNITYSFLLNRSHSISDSTRCVHGKERYSRQPSIILERLQIFSEPKILMLGVSVDYHNIINRYVKQLLEKF